MSQSLSLVSDTRNVSSNPKSKAKLAIVGVHYQYESASGKKTEALKDINLAIADGEFLAIVGPSGCGKSTLLNVMSGLLPSGSGCVTLDGSPLTGITPRIGYLSQADALLPWRTVIDNVELGLEIKGVPKKERRETARELMERVGLRGFEECYPHELSGGMKKRAAMVRTLAPDPEVLFMDEPFGALDVFTKEMLQDDIVTLWQATKKTIVFITHDLTEAITLADRVVVMTARPSTVKAEYLVGLPRPRKTADVRFSHQFIELQKAIWNDLTQEMKADAATAI